jgi:hypothetical protein
VGKGAHMQKIASPGELRSELGEILGTLQGPEKPSRRVLARRLRDLADRVAQVVIDKQLNGQRVTNLSPDEVSELRRLVKGLVKGNVSVRQHPRGSAKGWTDIRAEGASGEEYMAVLKLLKRKGYVTSVGIETEMQRIKKYNWDFAPGGITVFKPWKGPPKTAGRI